MIDFRVRKETLTGYSHVKVYRFRCYPLTSRRGRGRQRGCGGRRRRFEQFVFRREARERFHRRWIYWVNFQYRRTYHNWLRYSTWLNGILRWRCNSSIPCGTRFAVRPLAVFHRAIRVLDALLLGSIRSILLPHKSHCSCGGEQYRSQYHGSHLVCLRELSTMWMR